MIMQNMEHLQLLFLVVFLSTTKFGAQNKGTEQDLWQLGDS